MTPEITFADYKSIGTMETALSKHADEAFFELTENEQRIAEKIFKCLTETDRENREIRRALTIDKLCAVAEADFSDVAHIIDVFRREGRTFLMPPADVELNENSLVDISHESLIRKWGRLKTWVEEEGQSSRTYRRLAEDALLHQQNKMGFWNDPELKDALEWRESFRPNETWAALYKETGERQYNASFADAMRYLDESEIKRDEEIAEEARQQTALRKYARNLRWMLAGLGVFSILTIGVAIFALYQMNALAKEKKLSDIARNEKAKAFDDLKVKSDEVESQKEELSDSLGKQEKATVEAKEATLRADNEAKKAILSKAETQKALEVQKQLADEAKEAKDTAVNDRLAAQVAEKKARDSLTEATATKNREAQNRTGLILLEQGEFDLASEQFKALLKSFENRSESMRDEDRIDGRWWASHNLGIVYSKKGDFEPARTFYGNALKILEEELPYEFEPAQISRKYFQTVSYQAKDKKNRADEINRNKVATYRRLAQLFLEKAQNSTTAKDVNHFYGKAQEMYGELLNTLTLSEEKEKADYLADVYVEYADCFYGLNLYKQAKKYYEKAEENYESKNSFTKQVDVLKKWSAAALNPGTAKGDEEEGSTDELNETETSLVLLKKAIDIQENKMHLSPIDLEIADSYDLLDNPGYAAGGDGDGPDPLPYGELAGLIREVNNATTKTNLINADKVIALANTYIETGKCRRAENLYLYFINISEQTNENISEQTKEQREDLHSEFSYLKFYVGLVELYQDVLLEDENAEIYFDKLVAETKKDRTDGEARYIESGYADNELFERIGDFYFAKNKYQQAGEFYEYSLQKIKKDEKNSDVTLHKAKVLTKIARIDEAQNKLTEAEAQAKYSQAVNLVISKFGENDIAAAKILLYQADLYEKRGNKEKAAQIYNKADAILKNVVKFPMEKLALQIHIQKGLGDINKDSTAIAAKYYENAISKLKEYGKIKTDCAEKCTTVEEVTRYTEKDKLTDQYWIDTAEILEAWANLKGVENADKLKKNLKSAQQEVENRVRTIVCYDKNPDSSFK